MYNSCVPWDKFYLTSGFFVFNMLDKQFELCARIYFVVSFLKMYPFLYLETTAVSCFCRQDGFSVLPPFSFDDISLRVWYALFFEHMNLIGI